MYNKLTKEKLTEEILCVLKFLYKEDNDRVLVDKQACQTASRVHEIGLLCGYTIMPKYGVRVKCEDE